MKLSGTGIILAVSRGNSDPDARVLIADKPELTQAESFTLKVFFHNTSTETCDVSAYHMRWEGGDKRVELKLPFTVEAGKKEYQVVTVEGIKDEDALRRSLKVQTFCKTE